MSFPFLPRRLAACCALTVAAAAHATPFDTPGPFVEYGVDGTQRASVHTDQWVHLALPTTFESQPGTAVIDGQGGIGVGRMKLAASGAGYNAFAWAGWNERLTFTPVDPALVGQTVMVAFRLAYDWSASVSSPSPTSLDGEVYIDMNLLRPAAGLPNRYANFGEQVVRSCARPGECGDTLSFAGTGVPLPVSDGRVVTFTFPVTLGLTYPVVFGMNASAQGHGGAVTIDATHTMSWAGLGAVTLAGQPVAVRVAALSGLDYTQPIPEPGTWALWLAGLAAVAGRSRHRRVGGGPGFGLLRTRP